jgi:hypothetical protein
MTRCLFAWLFVVVVAAAKKGLEETKKRLARHRVVVCGACSCVWWGFSLTIHNNLFLGCVVDEMMDPLEDMDIGSLANNAASIFGSIPLGGDEFARCSRCSFGGCDVRVSGCGCNLHAVRSP